jgi:predicted ATPase
LHRAIAEAIEAASAGRLAEQLERLAHHYTEAGLAEQAVGYWQQAGQRAIGRSANAEAIVNLTKGLQLLESLPDTPDRSRQELAIQLGLGVGLQSIEGAESAEVGRAYTRAQELCQDVGEAADYFAALWGLWRFRHHISEFQTARELADELSDLAQRQNDPALTLQAHHAQWTTRFYFGEFAECCEHAEQAIAVYDARRHHAQTFRFGGHDPCVCGHSIAAISLYILGYPDQAVAQLEDGLSLAHELHHPQTLAAALEQGAYIHQLRREVLLAKERGEAAVEAAREHGLAQQFATSAFVDGWAAAGGGQAEEAIASIREGLAARRTAGRAIEEPDMLGYYIDLLARTGQANEGMKVLENAFIYSRDTETTYWDAELHRLRGVLLSLSDGNSDEAEACFKQAIEIARGQSARSFELRAATDLARLWQGEGKRAEARDLLAPVHDWFTEGFDTADLKDAKTLLDDLA